DVGQSQPAGHRTYLVLISLGDLFVQRRNARRKFAASLNPSASAISSFASLVVRRYFSASCIRSSSSRPRKEIPCSRSWRRNERSLTSRSFAKAARVGGLVISLSS